jgi:hypothetical protein
VVAPGADASLARLRFAGASKLKLDQNGDLEVIAKNGKVSFHKSVVYQQVEGKRKLVGGRFRLLAKKTMTTGVNW